MSSGDPHLLSGIGIYFFNSFSLSSVCMFIESLKFSVGIGPGAIALTLILGANSNARVAVKLLTAALEAPYGPFYKFPRIFFDELEDILIIAPPSFIFLAAVTQPLKTAVKLRFICASNSSKEVLVR